MSYSTGTKIRQEAGFSSNSNVLDATVTGFQSAATSQIDGVLSKIYTLPLSTTPSIIELIERKLAAGHLMLEEYGVDAEGTDKDGNSKVKWAENQLQMIEDGIIQLVGTDGVILAKSERIGMKGFPDATTGTDRTSQSDKDDPPKFEMGQTF